MVLKQAPNTKMIKRAISQQRRGEMKMKQNIKKIEDQLSELNSSLVMDCHDEDQKFNKDHRNTFLQQVQDSERSLAIEGSPHVPQDDYES
jgi:esterase/lipase